MQNKIRAWTVFNATCLKEGNRLDRRRKLKVSPCMALYSLPVCLSVSERTGEVSWSYMSVCDCVCLCVNSCVCWTEADALLNILSPLTTSMLATHTPTTQAWGETKCILFCLWLDVLCFFSLMAPAKWLCLHKWWACFSVLASSSPRVETIKKTEIQLNHLALSHQDVELYLCVVLGI